MKLTVKIFSLVVALALALSLVGCRSTGSDVVVSMATVVYADDELREDKTELLLVAVPSTNGMNNQLNSTSGAVLPSKTGVDKNGESVDIKAGDLIIMDFEESIYIRQDMTPKFFTDDPKKITVVAEGVELAVVGGNYNLSFPLSFVASKTALVVGDELAFYKGKNATTPTNKLAIKSINDEKVSVFVANATLIDIVNSLAFGKVEKA